jgi:hypothetical protein
MSDEKEKKRKVGKPKAPDNLEHRGAYEPPKDFSSQGRAYCGAKRQDGGVCKSLKTLANGRCKFHGGMSTGPKNNSGLHSTLHRDLFTEDELKYLDEINNDDIVKQYDNEIDIARIRLRRMLQKINDFKAKEWREVEKKETVGQQGNQFFSNTETTSQSTEAIIQKIEGDITKVQNQIMKLLNSKAQYLATINQDTQVDISVFVNAVKQNTENLWEDDDNGDNEEDKD